jgi:hypothetical protein
MARLVPRLREGTEVLRTGGGAQLSVADCNDLLDLIEAAQETVDKTSMIYPMGGLDKLEETLARVQNA